MKLQESYFPFYEFQYRIIAELPDEERLAAYDAMCSYAFDGRDLGANCTGEFRLVWPVIRDLQIEKRTKLKNTPNAKREPLSIKHRFMIFERDSFTCQYCGRSAPDVQLEVDHIQPVSKGGTNEQENLITACSECNRGKRAHVLGESRRW